MNIGLGDCTPVPTVVTGADGEPRVVYAGCPTETVDVTTGGTVVYHDNTTGQTSVSHPTDGISMNALAVILGGIAAVVLLARR